MVNLWHDYNEGYGINYNVLKHPNWGIKSIWLQQKENGNYKLRNE